MDNRWVNNRKVTLKRHMPPCPNLPHAFFVVRAGRWMTFQTRNRMGKGSLDLSKVIAEKGGLNINWDVFFFHFPHTQIFSPHEQV